tara:strand:+ start:956 stop:1288 length:333 start_codon:yes stop_codon:yes gene_type:complete
MIPVFDVSRLIGFAKNILFAIFLWTAFKALLITLVTVLVPWAIYKCYTMVGEKFMAFVGTFLADSAYEGTFVQLTGMGAWIAERLQLQTCFQILATFVVMRFVIGFFHKG